MKLFLVHCGFYDNELSSRIYESHVNYFVAAAGIDDAKARIKTHPEFVRKRMHVDGIEEVSGVEGWRVSLVPAEASA